MLIDNKNILIEEIKEDLRYCGFVNGSKISVDFETTKEIQNIVGNYKIIPYSAQEKIGAAELANEILA